jgi:hypothetical protein
MLSINFTERTLSLFYFIDLKKKEIKVHSLLFLQVTPDNSFVLDYHPLHRNIVIGAGFSGKAL